MDQERWEAEMAKIAIIIEPMDQEEVMMVIDELANLSWPESVNEGEGLRKGRELHAEMMLFTLLAVSGYVTCLKAKKLKLRAKAFVLKMMIKRASS